MFKLKPGNVFQKINKMDKKQAYTWGAIVVVCFVALLTLASFMGNADESSFDDFNTRGYDLAQMPFINDEAEEYLLASKYPDMQGNNSTMLYSAAEKEARQEEDAAAAAEGENAATEEDFSGEDSSSSGGYGGYTGGGYTGGGSSAAPTQVGQLDNASVSHASGSGVSTSWGAPRGDFSPYKSQEKGSEIPVQQLKTQDARRALAQFAQTSRAAAGLRDSKGANAKRALMGGHIQGSEAFTETGVDLSKSGGLALDTNAPVSSADLGNLEDAISDAADKGQQGKDDVTDDMTDRLLEQLWSGMINLGLQAVGNLMEQGIDALQGAIAGKGAYNSSLQDSGMAQASQTVTDENQKLLVEQFGADKVEAWRKANPNGQIWQCQADLSQNGQIARIPTKPTEPQRSSFVTPLEDGSTPSPTLDSSGEVVLGAKEQQNYEAAVEKYNRDLQDYNEYQQADAKGKAKIEASRAKKNQKIKESASKSYADYFGRDAEINKTSDYLAALEKKQAAAAKYVGRSNINTDNLSTTGGEKEWYSQYGKEYGDPTKYDQAAVAKCKGNAAPLTCLQGAKK